MVSVCCLIWRLEAKHLQHGVKCDCHANSVHVWQDTLESQFPTSMWPVTFSRRRESRLWRSPTTVRKRGAARRAAAAWHWLSLSPQVKWKAWPSFRTLMATGSRSWVPTKCCPLPPKEGLAGCWEAQICCGLSGTAERQRGGGGG